MKGKAFILGLALTLAVPVAAFAADADNQNRGREFFGLRDYSTSCELDCETTCERPEFSARFSGMQERLEGISKTRMGRGGFRVQMPEEVRVAIEELRNNFAVGELSKEEAREKMHELMLQFKGQYTKD